MCAKDRSELDFYTETDRVTVTQFPSLQRMPSKRRKNKKKKKKKVESELWQAHEEKLPEGSHDDDEREVASRE